LYAKSLDTTLGIWHQHAGADSCGLHNLQSAFPLALQYYVGVGGLDLRNAIQLLHTMFALYMELKKGWKKIVRAVWKKLRRTEIMPENLLDTEDAPKDVTQAMQEPLVTRWWTIGLLAQFASKYLDFLLLMAKACYNMTKTDHCIQPASFIGLIRLDSRRHLPCSGSRKVLAKSTHAVVPGVGPSHRHTRVSLFPPAG
jgi:hypothetical protein